MAEDIEIPQRKSNSCLDPSITDSILPLDQPNRSYVTGSHGTVASRGSTRHFCLPYVPGTPGDPTSDTG